MTHTELIQSSSQDFWSWWIFSSPYEVPRRRNKTNWFANIETNDCSVCAVLNALKALDINNISKEKVKQATRYNSNGGNPDTGLKIIADKLNLISEYYPKYDDLIWVEHPIKENIKYAPPELNKDKMFNEFKNRLNNGWIAVSTHRWEDIDKFHAVALVGVENDLIKVICSLKGQYLADENMFVSNNGHLNGGTTTFWVKG